MINHLYFRSCTVKSHRSFFLMLLMMVSSIHIYCQNSATPAGFKDDDEEIASDGDCGGSERWNVKVLTDADTGLVNYVPIATTIDSLITIPQYHPGMYEARIHGLEFQTYSVICYLKIKIFEDDNDYHLVMSEDTNTMIGEMPDPVCSEASHSSHVNEFIACRNWINALIPWDDYDIHISPVMVTGVLFQDIYHGQTGAAPNQLELHPILFIQFDSLVNTNIPDLSAHLLSVTISPNSFSESTNFSVKSSNIKLGKCILEIYATGGNKVKELYLPVSDNKEINYTFYRDNLAAGAYIYRILNNSNTLHEGKLIIQ